MGIKLTNNAFGTLASGINSSATSITLTTGQGARFPILSAGDYFYATLVDTSNNLEIVKCTARSTDVLTVVRGQETTTARAYSTGDRIEIRLTAQTFIDATEITATAVSDQANSSTGYFDLPAGSTAQRPGSPAVGNKRVNTTTNAEEVYVNGTWQKADLIGEISASGGTATTRDGYTYHTFTSTGNLVVSSGTVIADVLIVAGGGGGSNGDNGNDAGAGGGGGGVYLAERIALSAGTYTATVGAGGAGVSGTFRVAGNPGSNSSFTGLTTAIGGGRGGQCNTNGGDGGSGGGAGGGGGGPFSGGSRTTNQGFVGGGNHGTPAYTGAGGGGAGGSGGWAGGGRVGGDGGPGAWAWGSSYGGGGGGGGGIGGTGFYATQQGGAGGGAGAGDGGAPELTNVAGEGRNALANTGSGGGGGGSKSSVGGAGGSGIVIVRYRT